MPYFYQAIQDRIETPKTDHWTTPRVPFEQGNEGAGGGERGARELLRRRVKTVR